MYPLPVRGGRGEREMDDLVDERSVRDTVLLRDRLIPHRTIDEQFNLWSRMNMASYALQQQQSLIVCQQSRTSRAAVATRFAQCVRLAQDGRAGRGRVAAMLRAASVVDKFEAQMRPRESLFVETQITTNPPLTDNEPAAQCLPHPAAIGKR